MNGVVPASPAQAGSPGKRVSGAGGQAAGKEEAKEQEVRKEEEGGAACQCSGSSCSGSAGGCSRGPKQCGQQEAPGATSGAGRHAGCQGDAQSVQFILQDQS